MERDLGALYEFCRFAEGVKSETEKELSGVMKYTTGRSIATAERIEAFAGTARDAWDVLYAYRTYVSSDPEIENLRPPLREMFSSLKSGNVLAMSAANERLQEVAKNEKGKRVSMAVASVFLHLRTALQSVENDLRTYTPEELESLASQLGFVTPEGEIRFDYETLKTMEDPDNVAKRIQEAVDTARTPSPGKPSSPALPMEECSPGLENGGIKR